MWQIYDLPNGSQGKNYAFKFWVKNGRNQRSERNVEAVAGAEVEAAGQLKELEYFIDIEAEGGNGNRAIIFFFPSYAKQDS